MKTNNKEIMARRRRFTRQFWSKNGGMFTLALITTLLTAGINLFISWQMQQVVDVMSGTGARFTLPQLAIQFTFALLAIVLTLLLDSYSRPRFIKKAMEQYKNFAFAEIAKKGVGSFNGESTSTYISALSNDAISIETNYIAKIFPLIQELTMFVGAFVMMLLYSPLLTLVAFVLALFPVIGSLLTGQRLAVREKEVSDRNESFLGTVKDMLSGFSVIKSFKAEKEIVELFKKSNRTTEESKCRRKRTEILIQLIGSTAGILAQFGVFLFGAYLALAGRGVTAGVVIVFLQLMAFVITPISDVPQILANRKAAFALIDKLALAVSAHVRREGRTVPGSLENGIEVRELSFGYEAKEPVLKNLSAHFEAGKSYALVGGSGSGKSTLLSLLMGGRDDYAGTINYDGEELRGISSESLYDLVSIVQQNVFVFNSSLRDNITMFHAFDEPELQKAVKMSGLEAFWAQRGGEYVCGENGSGLSGGEKQRVSIARSLLRKTPVLLVDEATAALDAQTAFSVTNSILDISDLTRIIVTHRLEEPLLKRYDEILVLRGGRIEEKGTFEALMAQKGYFYSLFTVSQ